MFTLGQINDSEYNLLGSMNEAEFLGAVEQAAPEEKARFFRKTKEIAKQGAGKTARGSRQDFESRISLLPRDVQKGLASKSLQSVDISYYAVKDITNSKVVKMLIANGASVKGEKALILGFAFKENCPDVRNTKVIDIYTELQQFGMDVHVYDPWAIADEVHEEYGVTLEKSLQDTDYKAIIIAVAHDEFLELDYAKYKENGAIIFDTKSFIDRRFADARL